MFGLFDGLEVGGGYEGDGGDGDALELDDDALVLLDATDDALDALEIAIGDAHLRAGLSEEVIVPRHDRDTVVGGRGDPDEVGHLLVGDGEDVVVQEIGHVAQGLVLALEHLHLGDALLGGMEEDEVAHGGDVAVAHMAALVGIDLVAHGEEILHGI